MLLLIPLVAAQKDCITLDPLTRRDIPCQLIVPFPLENPCNSYTIKFYNSTPSLIGQTNLDSYTGTDLCNASFNFTNITTYFCNISSGDSVRIEVEVDEEMILSITIALSVFALIFVGLGIYLWQRKGKE